MCPPSCPRACCPPAEYAGYAIPSSGGSPSSNAADELKRIEVGMVLSEGLLAASFQHACLPDLLHPDSFFSGAAKHPPSRPCLPWLQDSQARRFATDRTMRRRESHPGYEVGQTLITCRCDMRRPAPPAARLAT